MSPALWPVEFVLGAVDGGVPFSRPDAAPALSPEDAAMLEDLEFLQDLDNARDFELLYALTKDQ